MREELLNVAESPMVQIATIAERIVKQSMSDLDKNDDELRKVVASRAYADGAYPFDVICARR